MNYLNRAYAVIYHGLINAGRTRARQALLRRDERFLTDTGFSRQLLEQGNGSWPWRADDAVLTSTSLNAPSSAELRSPVPDEPLSIESSYRAAEAELKSFNDSELTDLGIARSGIAEAVRNGRPGMDNRPMNESSHVRKAA